MNHLSSKLALNISALLFSVLLLGSCSKSKDDDNNPGGGGYPKEVTIEYRVKATGGNIKNADVTFMNESGGMDMVENTVLPFSKKIKKTVKAFDGFSIRADANVGGSLQVDILVNDQVVETKSGSGTSVVLVQAMYQFPL